jgi:hypothetical protein
MVDIPVYMTTQGAHLQQGYDLPSVNILIV